MMARHEVETQRERVIKVLRFGSLIRTQILERTGVKFSAIIERLLKDGKLVKAPNHTEYSGKVIYGLKKKGRLNEPTLRVSIEL